MAVFLQLTGAVTRNEHCCWKICITNSGKNEYPKRVVGHLWSIEGQKWKELSKQNQVVFHWNTHSQKKTRETNQEIQYASKLLVSQRTRPLQKCHSKEIGLLLRKQYRCYIETAEGPKKHTTWFLHLADTKITHIQYTQVTPSVIIWEFTVRVMKYLYFEV